MFICIAKIPAGIQKPLFLHTAKGNRTHRDAYKHTETKNRKEGQLVESHTVVMFTQTNDKGWKILTVWKCPVDKMKGTATWFPHLAVVWIAFSKSARNWLIQWVDIHDNMGKKSKSKSLFCWKIIHLIWSLIVACCTLTHTNIYQNDFGPNSKIRYQATSVTYRWCDRVCSDVVWTATGKKYARLSRMHCFSGFTQPQNT